MLDRNDKIDNKINFLHLKLARILQFEVSICTIVILCKQVMYEL